MRAQPRGHVSNSRSGGGRRARIKAPTLAFGGAEDSLAGPAKVFQDRMKFIAESVPNGRGRLNLLPGLGHVPHLEAPAGTYPPLLAFLKEGVR